MCACVLCIRFIKPCTCIALINKSDSLWSWMHMHEPRFTCHRSTYRKWMQNHLQWAVWTVTPVFSLQSAARQNCCWLHISALLTVICMSLSITSWVMITSTPSCQNPSMRSLNMLTHFAKIYVCFIHSAHSAWSFTQRRICLNIWIMWRWRFAHFARCPEAAARLHIINMLKPVSYGPQWSREAPLCSQSAPHQGHKKHNTLVSVLIVWQSVRFSFHGH